MSKVNYAAIDIGSNAVRLLIKSINPETSEQLFKGSPASGRRSIYTR